MAELALTMPKMSMTMEEGTMVAWLKDVGDAVRSGEPVCEVATDKVDMEVESPFEGTIARITALPDDVVKVGDPIAYITTDADDLLGGLFDEPAPEVSAEADGIPEGDGRSPRVEARGRDGDVAKMPPHGEWVAAVPLARVVAADSGVDLHRVVPSGPWGSVRVADVEAMVAFSPASLPSTPPVSAAQTPFAASGESSVGPVQSRRRRTRLRVAKAMVASATVPQFTAFRELDLVALSAMRKSDMASVSWTAVLLRAHGLALRMHPQLNGFWTDEGVMLNEDIGIALAVDSPTGLLAPVLRNPDLGPLNHLAVQISQLVEAARSGSISAEQLQGGTTVFSNLGGLGVDSFNALLTPPHATALSAGSIRDRVVAVDAGAFGLRLTCTVGLTVDHRVADGADAARYLNTLEELVHHPERLISH
ncbi:MAG: 2-oxo acid dehydrogenase subunit E2 [Microbacteriaceae bacterium]|nr:MAG: 2-oxo acid dehydrogenase subunit E2 [Microbacteriaceae bacterium]